MNLATYIPFLRLPRIRFAFNWKRDFLGHVEAVKLLYSKQEIVEAGRVLIEETDPALRNHALTVLDNWRAFHNIPLDNFYVRLKSCMERVCPQNRDKVSRRLKRTKSVIAKINDMGLNKMNPYKMQDIAGCRALLETVPQVYRIFNEYYGAGKYADHSMDNWRDYIDHPRESGYRSIHVICVYNETTSSPYNGRHVEVQLRTSLQHAWATAVETVETFLGLSLRRETPENKKWRDFFKLVSSAFAMREDSPLVPGTATTERLLQERIKEALVVLSVRNKLEAFAGAIKVIKEKKLRSKHYLLALYPEERKLHIKGYSERRFQEASKANLELEKQGVQSVLIGADSLKLIPKMYPNYYLDTKLFLSEIDKFLALQAVSLPFLWTLDDPKGDTLMWGELQEE